MRIERISFASTNTGVKSLPAKTEGKQNKQENISQNTNSKYVIGTVIGITALTGIFIAGRKGYLGTKIKNILGNGEKNIKNTKNIEIKENNVPTTNKSESSKIKETLNNYKKTNDIIKDGKKIGIEIKDYKGNDLICTTTKTFNELGEINTIKEKYTNGKNIEIRRTKVNHNNKDYTVWRYFEMPEKGSSKSINFKLDENNDYTFDLICVYPNEIETIKQKLADNGIKLGKCLTNY